MITVITSSELIIKIINPLIAIKFQEQLKSMGKA